MYLQVKKALGNKTLFLAITVILLLAPIAFSIVTAGAFSGLGEKPDPFSSLEVEVKPTYFLGEDVVVSINSYSEDGKVLSASAWKKIKLIFVLTGIFNDDHGKVTSKKFTYDGSVPPMTERKIDENTTAREIPPDTAETRSKEDISKFDLDLPRQFNSTLGVGSYSFSISSEAGYELEKKFEVVFDQEKSTPALETLLLSESMANQNWAFYNLAKFNRNKLISILEKMKISNEEKLRDRGKRLLYEMKISKL